MKPICLLLTCFLLGPVVFIHAQDSDRYRFNPNPFASKKWMMDADRYLSYSSYNNYTNGVKTTQTNRFSINAGATYFFKDGLGLNLDLSARFSNTENGIDVKGRDWMVWGGLTYGRQFGNNFNAYLQGNIGAGREKDIVTNTSGGQNESIYKDFGYKGELGALIGVNNGPWYVNPYVSYRHINTDFDNGEEFTNKFGLGVRLRTSLTCDEYECDSERGYPQARTRYLVGSDYFDYTTHTMFSTGDVRTEYDNLFTPDESDVSNFKFDFDYAHYFLNYVYGGIEGKFTYDRSEPGSQPGYVYTTTEYLAILKVGANIPSQTLWLRNFYGEFGYGLGSEKFKIDDNGNVNEIKDKVTYIGVSVGYNWFVGDRVAIVPRLAWTKYTNENDDAIIPQEQEKKGIGASVGVRLFLE